MPDILPSGPPGLGSQSTATYRRILLGGEYTYLPGGRIIDGSKARDWGNTGDLGTLRPGVIMGLTSSNTYAPSILGVNQSAYSSGGTEVTVTAAQAVEIVRRVGSSGNLKYVGPPTANGTVAVTANINYSAINTTTGVITTSSLGADYAAGSFVVANDGSGYPVSFIPEHKWGIKVTDVSGTSVTAVPYPQVPVAGIIDASQLVGWPTDTSLQKWIMDSLNGNLANALGGSGAFVFDHRF